jgi:hypothetical protein
MKPARYANAFVQNTPILLGQDQTQYGCLLSEYDVREYWDLRTSAQSGAPMRAYLVSLKQRLTLANTHTPGFAKLAPASSYPSYPVLAVQSVQPKGPNGGLTFYLEDYTPKTLNASVNTSHNDGTSSQQSSSVQHSAGSSTSVTNSWEVSDSVGFFGMDPTGSVSAGFGGSTTTTEERSMARSRGQERGAETGSAASMSIKDWASYAFLDAAKQQPSWVWGQEYPWNVINFRGASDSDGKNLVLPPYVQQLLCDGSFLYPPSQIAQFGLNFVAHARWVFCADAAPGPADETVTFSHKLTYWEATHSSTGDPGKLTLAVSLQPIAVDLPIETLTLNLPVLALEPIVGTGLGNGAVVGFVQSEFIVPPGVSDTQFRLKSSANNLYVSQGSGFGSLGDDDAILSAKNVSVTAPASFKVRFKIVDPDIELSLHLKHWKTTAESCKLTVTVNGQDIVRHVDAMNAASGADNITSITLRSRDYTSPDYYDYLVMGVNTIDVVIKPGDGADTCNYALRALAVQ